MKVVVIGLGIQGYKRMKFSGDDLVCAVDPVNKEAKFRDIRDVSLESFDAALVCTPDEPKYDILKYCLENKKHVLVEKPLWTPTLDQISELETLARNNKLVCYTAYNHRFEPHFVKMRELLSSGELGNIYSCRMFYGNGTARLVRNSAWRDVGAGVLPDLGSHLLDTCKYWFENNLGDFTLNSSFRFENKAPDHVIIESLEKVPRISLEMSLCMWRNHFTCDILAEKGTAHIESLCKWGPSTFTHRKRILPSGRPPEQSETLVKEDPTWDAEYLYFKRLVQTNARTNLSNDAWIQGTLELLGEKAKK